MKCSICKQEGHRADNKKFHPHAPQLLVEEKPTELFEEAKPHPSLTNDVALTPVNSFATHYRSAFWSSKNFTNINDVSLTHQKRYWFNCDKCSHEFEQYVYHIVKSDVWCPYCANKKLCANEECKMCFGNSFASSEKALFWSSKNIGKPREFFKNCGKKFKFNCECGAEFESTLNNVTFGKWCKLCGFKSMKEKQLLTLENFVSRSIKKFSDKYDYSKVQLVGVDRPVTIFCKIHNIEFKTTPYRHYTYETGCCPICVGNKILTTEEFIIKASEIHNDDYNYSHVIYIRSNQKIKICCKRTGLIFTQTPNNHLRGNGCPCCKPKFSKPQMMYLSYLSISNPSLIHALNGGEVLIEGSRYLADGFIPEKKHVIEFHGCFWHGCQKCFSKDCINPLTKRTFGEELEKTRMKQNFILANGYTYSEIWECEWRCAVKAISIIQKIWKLKKIN